MNINQMLAAILAGTFVGDGVDAYLIGRGAQEPTGWFWFSSLALSLLIFGWYRRDSDALGFRRSTGLNIAIAAAAIVAIPYYLIRSRSKGQRRRALLRFLGFAALYTLSSLCGSFIGEAVGS